MKDNHGFYKALAVLVKDIFACFLSTDYEDHLYLYEHRIHNSKVNFLSLTLKHATAENLTYLHTLYNGVIDGGLLRWRVKDKSVFTICSKEMIEIRDALVALCHCSEKQACNDAETSLTAGITAFESIYQSILQVSAKEPLPFLLFIQSLKTLKEALCEP